MKHFALLLVVFLSLFACFSKEKEEEPPLSFVPSSTAAVEFIDEPQAEFSQESDVRQQNKEIAERAYQEYLAGEDYWESVDENIQLLDSNRVFWVPNGKSYHSTIDCVALLRSTDIRSGTLQGAFAAGKVDPCSKCVGD